MIWLVASFTISLMFGQLLEQRRETYGVILNKFSWSCEKMASWSGMFTPVMNTPVGISFLTPIG
jgi:hypothetical protein